MEKLTDKKKINKIVILFSITYMISYITRINYGAIIAEMVKSTGMTKSALSMALTGSFITYGTGQIISGICGDRISPKKLVSMGLGLSVIMNFLIPICSNGIQMLAVWCVNGFAQSFMWPPMVRLMTSLLTDDDYKKATVKVSWGSSFGTIFVYLISPVIISLLSWKYVFIFSAVCGIIMIFMWQKNCYDVKIEEKNKNKNENVVTGNKISVFSPVIIGVMIAIVLQGMLRDGVTTWMPSYISESYNISSVISILTGVILPVFSILCFQLASNLYRKKFTNPLTCAGVFFAFGAASAAALCLITGKNAAFSVLLSAILTGCMHGVNLILICMVPAYFQKSGNVSTVSGILNSCTYVGSSISTYAIALISEKMGWNYTLFVWFMIAVAGMLMCFVCIKPWKDKFD